MKSFGIRISLIISFFIFYFSLPAQIAWIEPVNATQNDTVTVFYNAAAGNQTLKDYSGTVYLHTGIISTRSLDGHDWKYVVGNWGTDDVAVRMMRVKPNLYSLRVHVASFYNLKPEDKALQLAFVFRNEAGTVVGKTKDNEDILVPINGYIPPKITEIQRTFDTRKLTDLKQIANGWQCTTNDGIVTIRPFSDDVVEVVWLKNESDRPQASHAVVVLPQSVQTQTKQTPSGYELQSGNVKIVVGKSPFRLAFYRGGKLLLEEAEGFYHKTDNSGVRFKMQKSERIYGLGERAVSIDRRGYRVPLYNRPFYGYEMGALMLNYSVPMTLSNREYAVLFDNPQKGYADVGKTESDILEWGTMGGTLRYYVVSGNNWAGIMKNYTALTGHQNLPPRWAFGNLMSRMAYRTQKETDSIVNLMIQKNFPVDAVIIDFYWFGDSIKGHLGRLDWYRKSWPQPEQMIADFKNKGIKTILITEPYIIDTMPTYKDALAHDIFVKDSLGRPYLDKQFYFGNGSLIDIFKPEAQDWFWEKYNKQIKIGVASWWGDLGEPESHPEDIHHVNGKANEVHNIYGHYWAKMVFEKYAEHYPQQRLFSLMRAGFAGTQRYNIFPWTGDVGRGWSSLEAQPPLLLSMSMNGLGYIHSDAGGFAQGVKDPELYTRWLQFACFTPVLRPHGSDIPSEPVFWDEQTQNIVRNYMNFRYKMLPYNYSIAYENSQNGTPLMRPLYFHHPNDTIAQRIGDEYYWGENMLVAPVYKKGQTTRKVYLPQGNWYDGTNKKYEGGKWVDIPLTIKEIPVFFKEGAFIPLAGKPFRTTDQYDPTAYHVFYYPATTQTTFTQYEDDGHTYLPQDQRAAALIRYKGKKEENKITIWLDAEKLDALANTEKSLQFSVLNPKGAKSVIVNGQKVTNFTNIQGETSFELKWNGIPAKIEILN